MAKHELEENPKEMYVEATNDLKSTLTNVTLKLLEETIQQMEGPPRAIYGGQISGADIKSNIVIEVYIKVYQDDGEAAEEAIRKFSNREMNKKGH
jgi:hypothetical protein